MQIIFVVDDAKVKRIVDAVNELYPVPTDDQGQSLFTSTDWVKEHYRRKIIDDVRRYENEIAKAAVSVQPDNTLVT